MVMSQSVQQTGTTQWWSYQIQLLNTPLSKLKSEYLMLTDHIKHFKNNPDYKKKMVDQYLFCSEVRKQEMMKHNYLMLSLG